MGTSQPQTPVLVLRLAFLPYLLLPIRQLLESLADRDYQVTLVKTRPRDTSTREELVPGINQVLLKLWTRKLPKSRWLEPLVYLEFVFRSLVHGARAHPALVIAVDLDTLLPALILGRVYRVPVVYYSLELYTEREGFELRWFWEWLERRLINAPDLVVACEPHRAEFMQQRYGAKTQPMVVLNVPRRTGRYHTAAIQEYLQERGVGGEFFLYYHGAITRNRCADQFVEALARLPEPIILFLIGPIQTRFREELMVRAHTLGVAHRVILRGVVDSGDLENYARSAHVGLQVQRNDGLNHYYCAPIKLFQYLAAGLPVIAPDFPGMRQIVAAQNLGFCVDPEDADALAGAILKLYEDPALRNAMAESAYALSQSRYCYEVEGEKLLNALDALAAPMNKPL